MLKDTGEPELAVPVNTNGASKYVFDAKVLNVTVCAARATTNERSTGAAAK
jgi:hypothetical protein